MTGKKIELKYPAEMELWPDPRNSNHFGIRPEKNFAVEPAKFKQVSLFRIEKCSSMGIAQGLTMMSNKKQHNKMMVVNLASTPDPRKNVHLWDDK